MTLTTEDLNIIREHSENAAIKAGKIILKYKKDGFTTLNKDCGSSTASMALTEVDIFSQDLILKSINPLIERYDLGLLTEEGESDNSRLIKDYFFSIDPMDGTKAFIDKDEGFSVSIALVNKNGEPVVGVVFDPVNKNLYSSVLGEGVKKNGESWIPEILNIKKTLRVLVDPSYNRVKAEDIEYIEYGGAVLNSIKVLEGEANCYFKPPKKSEGGGSIWDFSAVTLFFNELNFIAHDFYGDKIQLNNPDSTFMNKRGIFYAQNNMVKEILVNSIKF